MCSEGGIRNVGAFVGLLFPGNPALLAGVGYFVVGPNEIHEAFAVLQPMEKVPRPMRTFTAVSYARGDSMVFWIVNLLRLLS